MKFSESTTFVGSFLLLAAAALAAPLGSSPSAPETRVYKICVPEVSLASCEKMKSDLAADQRHTQISCVGVRDRIDCLDKIKSNVADFGAVDPEDIYVASKIFGQNFNVFKEIRTKEEPLEEFRYEAVAVIHKDLKIDSPEGLRGLKSCHTGIGRNVGYKIPLTKLTNMGVLGPMNDSSISSRENELKALSQFFSKACLVGKWASDAEYSQRLKATYPNLCELCENPTACDYPDKFSGYDGALRCLSENGGDVAWTKVYYVKKHFGIGGRPATAVNVDDYRYLCPDGSKVPVTSKPDCNWAARPWQGYLMIGTQQDKVTVFKTFISLAESIGEKSHAEWLTNVLNLNENSTAVDNAQPLSPIEYLNKAKYTDVIERNWGSKAPVRFCVISDVEFSKCKDLARSAFSRDIRPEFHCVQKETLHDCLKTIRDGDADVITLDGGEVSTAQSEYGLKPIVSEQYGASGSLYYAVAVVKKTSTYQSIAELKGAKSCHTGIGRTAGWNIPLYTLLKKGLISKTTCPHTKAVAEFFSGGSCVPGVLSPEANPQGSNPTSLCSLCAGNSATSDTEKQLKSKCSLSSDEDFFGYSGAFRCLASGAGDVAFVKHTTVPENTDGHNTQFWASELKSSDYELLCLNGGRAPIDQYQTCNLAEVPPHSMVTSGSKTENEVDSIRYAVLSAGSLYAKKPEVFKLFGQYGGKKDLLFKDSTTGLVATQGVSTVQEKYTEIMKVIKSCGV